MKWLNGWTAALGALGIAALWNSQRSGEMTEQRDRIYRDCLSGRVPPEKMRKVADAFEKARCYPQARMLRLRVELSDLPPEIQAQRRADFAKGMASKNGPGVLRLAQAFEDQGATSSAAKLRRHARALAKAAIPETAAVVPPPPKESPGSDPPSEPPSERTEPTEPAIPIPGPPKVPTESRGTEPTNGKSAHHVAISESVAAVFS